MKKTIILSFLVLILTTSCSSESVIEEPTKPSEINTFNETIEENRVIIEGEKYEISETMQETFHYKDDSEQLEKKTYESNAEEISFNFVEAYEYKKDRVVKESFSSENGETISETYYTYDDQDRVIESRAVLQANDKEIVKKYSYGKHTKTLLDYLPDEKFLRKVITYYDDNEQIVKIESYDTKDQLTMVTNVISVDDYTTKEVSKENKEVTVRRQIKKNNMGDIIKFLSIVSLDDEPHTMFYLVDNVYDDNMRLVKKTQYKVVNEIEANVLETIYFD